MKSKVTVTRKATQPQTEPLLITEDDLECIVDHYGSAKTYDVLAFYQGRLAHVRQDVASQRSIRFVTLRESLKIEAEILLDENRSETGSTEPVNFAKWLRMAANAIR